ncbi:MAG: glycosyltransferase family 2 protein [Deltaproteobacteria bacterium]|nr:glycosyltransferase family 2 protein [Deltaproteobacteria bacterium]
MNLEISIGLTFYNNADTLRDALRSIFAQSFPRWELIVIDDHSTDGSFEIVQSVKDPRVRLYREDERKGFVAALNRMAEMAECPYYARMDADDMMHPERLRKQLEFLKSSPDVDVVDTAMYSMDQKGKTTGVRSVNVIDSNPMTLLRGRFFHHATVMGRTEWFRQHPYDPAFIRAEDCELWCRTYGASRFSRIGEALYFVREGLVNVNNYLQSGKTVRKIIKTYGPRYVGTSRTLQLIAESYLKGFVYRIFSSVNAHDILVDMRNRKLNEQDRENANGIIEYIQSTPVPGF